MMRAMVLAAGFGKRLQPITLAKPKPLVEIAGRTLLDRALDQLAVAGIDAAIVNVHYLGDQIMAVAQAGLHRVAMTISDERDGVLETGGGVVKALPLLGPDPFITINADTFWVEKSSGDPTIARMVDQFDAARMDILLLVCAPERVVGHSGGVDFIMDDHGRLRRAQGADMGLIYAGVAIMHPRIFDGADVTPHSLNRYFDAAIAADRLYGMALENAVWYTVSTPESLAAVEKRLRLDGDMAPFADEDI